MIASIFFMRKCLSASPVRQVLPARLLDAHNVPDFHNKQQFRLKISKTTAIMRQFRQKTRGKSPISAIFSTPLRVCAKFPADPKRNPPPSRLRIVHMLNIYAMTSPIDRPGLPNPLGSLRLGRPACRFIVQGRVVAC